MRVMLDTHAFLWFVGDEPRLSERARALIEDRATDPFLSIASVWELAIKVGLGKLTPHVPFPMLISEQLKENGIALLDITVAHALRVAQLPYHHRDPFDRMLIAQAITEGLPIISVDSVFDAYSVTRIW
ncbi:MAG: type II toxin-antitoxin system VapC family toxin [Chloroflexota bacterium]|nr:type II toxin-antitoxin system VapC family toxin [Chloroflexota bacterium]MDQ6905541.1 type II toxin-antitoxin system VapC family toxin [Chloroflexota bacterium]